MSKYQDTYDAHQRARFMRPDAARYMRPDAARYIRPDVARFLRPGTDPADVFPALDRKYSPSQRRVPAGRPGGGRWTDGEQGGGAGGGSSGAPGAGTTDSDVDFPEQTVSVDSTLLAYSDDTPSVLIDTTDWVNDRDGQPEIIQVADDGKPITDSYGNPYYAEGGHHEMARGVFKKWDLLPETREVLEDSTTGTLPKGRVPIDETGILKGHFWDGKNGAHGQYNQAIDELSQQFFEERGITPERMTPDQARDLLKEIREAEDPRIRNYNSMIRMLRRIYRFPGGRE